MDGTKGKDNNIKLDHSSWIFKGNLPVFVFGSDAYLCLAQTKINFKRPSLKTSTSWN